MDDDFIHINPTSKPESQGHEESSISSFSASDTEPKTYEDAGASSSSATQFQPGTHKELTYSKSSAPQPGLKNQEESAMPGPLTPNIEVVSHEQSCVTSSSAPQPHPEAHERSDVPTTSAPPSESHSHEQSSVPSAYAPQPKSQTHGNHSSPDSSPSHPKLTSDANPEISSSSRTQPGSKAYEKSSVRPSSITLPTPANEAKIDTQRPAEHEAMPNTPRESSFRDSPASQPRPTTDEQINNASPSTHDSRSGTSKESHADDFLGDRFMSAAHQEFQCHNCSVSLPDLLPDQDPSNYELASPDSQPVVTGDESDIINLPAPSSNKAAHYNINIHFTPGAPVGPDNCPADSTTSPSRARSEARPHSANLGANVSGLMMSLEPPLKTSFHSSPSPARIIYYLNEAVLFSRGKTTLSPEVDVYRFAVEHHYDLGQAIYGLFLAGLDGPFRELPRKLEAMYQDMKAGYFPTVRGGPRRLLRRVVESEERGGARISESMVREILPRGRYSQIQACIDY